VALAGLSKGVNVDSELLEDILQDLKDGKSLKSIVKSRDLTQKPNEIRRALVSKYGIGSPEMETVQIKRSVKKMIRRLDTVEQCNNMIYDLESLITKVKKKRNNL